MPDCKGDNKRPPDYADEFDRTEQWYVDEAVDESFPASDPPPWTTSGSRSVAAMHERDTAGSAAQHLAEQVSNLTRDFYHRGEAYIQEGRKHLPKAERYYRQGTEVVNRSLHENPLTAVIVAGAIGCALGWVLGRRMSVRRPVRQWRPVYNRRPEAAHTWHWPPKVSMPRPNGPFATQDRAEIASHTNNSF